MLRTGDGPVDIDIRVQCGIDEPLQSVRRCCSLLHVVGGWSMLAVSENSETKGCHLMVIETRRRKWRQGKELETATQASISLTRGSIAARLTCVNAQRISMTTPACSLTGFGISFPRSSATHASRVGPCGSDMRNEKNT